ncbi:hypothetical protein FKR81_27490 [Lentzea tibetensis]|uniref:Uncharacterized protein n=1 Tax=Lentzea tibetensis TaxID=2591470 RepID=A0A563EMX0_9PSEU|nr:hypothetical protein [Lentzea tibetensis]TWP48668.1 hypothetical protein FKR81_27490 [Lentzea tibetensis]
MLIRIVTAVACLAIGVVLRANGLGLVQLAIFAALVVITVLMPASAAPALVIAFAAVVMTFADGNPLRIGVLVLIPLLHLVHVTSALAVVIPRKAGVEMSALRAPARRFAAVQAVALALAGIAALLPSGPTPVPLEVAGLASAALVAALVALRI